MATAHASVAVRRCWHTQATPCRHSYNAVLARPFRLPPSGWTAQLSLKPATALAEVGPPPNWLGRGTGQERWRRRRRRRKRRRRLWPQRQ
eukprot:363312-Chlamydomonas_euryale.AAC.6